MTLRNNQYSDAVLSGEADLVQERTTLFSSYFFVYISGKDFWLLFI